MELAIPGFGTLRLEHLVLDYNGTLALDGRVLPGVKPRLRRLARSLRIHVVTGEDRAKATYVRRLGPRRVACIGNGRNDRLMLRVAGLGIAVVQAEGASAEALAAADLVVPTASDALDLLLRPRRLLASLRS
jgi:soluble P-type ATPase